jgi:hypothetical protein
MLHENDQMSTDLTIMTEDDDPILKPCSTGLIYKVRHNGSTDSRTFCVDEVLLWTEAEFQTNQ